MSFAYARNAANAVYMITQSGDIGYGPAAGLATLEGGSHSYMASALNQYSAVDGTSYNYDGNGNLVADGTYAYAFDPRNQLVRAVKSASGGEVSPSRPRSNGRDEAGSTGASSRRPLAVRASRTCTSSTPEA